MVDAPAPVPARPKARTGPGAPPVGAEAGREAIGRVSVRALRITFLSVTALVMLIPLYLLVIGAFKSQQDILTHPFSPTLQRFTGRYLSRALHNPDFNVLRGYGVTILFVVLVNVLSVALAGPVSYVIGRGRGARYQFLLLFFVAGTFIPSQVLVIPVVYTLKALSLMGTIRGFVLFETSLTLPFSIFLYASYIRTLPVDIDEAAALDGAGRLRIFWRVILPLMRPVIATMVVLNTISIWNDFVNPQIILGPGSGLYTVTTGIYAAVGQYSTDYTVVFPTLLLAIAPVLVFFIFMQRYIVGGLTAGATKG